jgi:signal transduction histidine kinase
MWLVDDKIFVIIKPQAVPYSSDYSANPSVWNSSFVKDLKNCSPCAFRRASAAGFFLRRAIACFLLMGNLARGAQMGTDATYLYRWQVNSYADDAGLAQQRVFDIAFARDGIVWLAADDGLHQFDGFQWKRFGTNEGLPSVFVRAVKIDQRDRLWVGTDKGAGIFDPVALKFDFQGSKAGLANQNVREIDQDPDGTLWFSCDQWPDNNAKPGGLSRFQNGSWQTFRQADGLPMDYVIGYFRDSTGRQFAMTPQGWAQRIGEGRWGPPADPGHEALTRVLHMAESANGTLFAQGESAELILAEGKWNVHSGGFGRLLCECREGEMMAIEYDEELNLFWYSRWDGKRFSRTSAMLDAPTDARFYHLRQSPDGSLWCVGKGTVSRWAYQDDRWLSYSQLPKIVGSDVWGRTWFARSTNVVYWVSNQFVALPPGKLVGWDQNGSALLWTGETHKLEQTDPQNPFLRSTLDIEFSSIELVREDGSNGFWIAGTGVSNELQMAHCQAGHAKKIDVSTMGGWRLGSANSACSNQLLVVAHNEHNAYGLVLVNRDKIEWQPINSASPALTYFNWYEAAGRRWLCGYAGVYEQENPPSRDWRQVDLGIGEGFGTVLTGPTEALFLFGGGRLGNPGAALFSSNRWTIIHGDFSNPTYGANGAKMFLSSRDSIYIRKNLGNLDLGHLSMPGGARVHLVSENQNGDIWLSTSDGILRYRPGRTPPQARILASVTEVIAGRPLPVSFSGLTRFETGSNPQDFHYSWRVDRQAWSPFEPGRHAALMLPSLAPGKHLLEVKSRDVDGNISLVAAQLPFAILAVPLQQRSWFYPSLTVLTLALAWLIWQYMAHVGKIAKANAGLSSEIAVRRRTETELVTAREELELRVIRRTEELTQANEQLKREISERKKAEEQQRALETQLHQSQKMEAIGTLAGGIAHDFNNILAVIIPYCDILMEEMKGRPELQEHLREMLRAACRARDLVQQILTFSHRQRRQQRKVCDIGPVVKEALKLLRSALPSSIQMETNVGRVHPVLADPTQIHQVVMNLCVNSQHAMEGRQGLLQVKLDECNADAAMCQRSADLQPGLHVRLTVRDNGCGISAEHLKRIFEPFFTTREVGQGTGLGLAVVHGIVRDHDGAILVESHPGRGTEFQVLLPAQMAVAGADGAPLPPLPAARGEHVLIVDDEVALAKVLKRMLLRGGYTATVHNDPRAALADFIARPKDIHLVLTDLTMPGMSGLELADKLHEIRPDLPLLMATGFGGNLMENKELAARPYIRRVVNKPLKYEEVLRAVAEVLHS